MFPYAWPPSVIAQKAISNAIHESTRIEQPVRIELLFQRAHQDPSRAGLAPDIDLIFDLVGRAQNEHLASANSSQTPHLGEFPQTFLNLTTIEPSGVAMQSNDAVRRVRA